MKFLVTGTALVTVYAEVEADTLDQAKFKADRLPEHHFYFGGKNPDGMVVVDDVQQMAFQNEDGN